MDVMIHLVKTGKRNGGFTLIEMMVVIALIAIVVAFASPGLKKAYEDFKVNETIDRISTFISSYRSYYLIRNEFPTDTNVALILTSDAWALPGSYYTRTKSGTDAYILNIKPYKGSSYDIDGWLESGTQEFYISIHVSDTDWWAPRLRKRFRRVIEKSGYVSVADFEEVNSGVTFEATGFRNRYY